MEQGIKEAGEEDRKGRDDLNERRGTEGRGKEIKGGMVEEGER